jgi:dihydroxy-acid dehydratase
MRQLLEADCKPRDIVTRVVPQNAMRLTIVLGGSTNAVLHSIAMAHAFGIELTIEDWQEASRTTPLLADLKPSGRYVMEDLHKVGRRAGGAQDDLLAEGMIDGDQRTVTGKTLAENLADLDPLPPFGTGR